MRGEGGQSEDPKAASPLEQEEEMREELGIGVRLSPGGGGQPVPVCLGLKDVLGCGTLSAKTQTVLGESG